MPILEGVVIGAVGGCLAGVSVYAVQYVHNRVRDHRESERLFAWLRDETKDEPGERYRSTRALASWNNLTEDRVRFLCSLDERIHLSTGEKEDMWGVLARPGSN